MTLGALDAAGVLSIGGLQSLLQHARIPALADEEDEVAVAAHAADDEKYLLYSLWHTSSGAPPAAPATQPFSTPASSSVRPTSQKQPQHRPQFVSPGSTLPATPAGVAAPEPAAQLVAPLRQRRTTLFCVHLRAALEGPAAASSARLATLWPRLPLFCGLPAVLGVLRGALQGAGAAAAAAVPAAAVLPPLLSLAAEHAGVHDRLVDEWHRTAAQQARAAVLLRFTKKGGGGASRTTGAG